ncbi:DNA-processing protein DprA [Gilvimarinus xylanilyticus]|uniref:DNA-processing protein DprA n=1 Tax=Gilvimarinus xylanilyticus TaxID=2944139 RepID=A0A9X2I6U4_9GAMM|nr:DNA-processing protein DprA [Gilvimarinus xylanilyticus]MCP8900532.1 DNA-processing protein DprA [Gilvimarinus xylanilyticus]
MDNLTSALTLARIDGLGAVKIKRLYLAFGSLPAVFKASADQLGTSLEARLVNQIDTLQDDERHPIHRLVALDKQWLADNPEVRILSLGDAAYPQLLADTPAPPPVLYVRGNADALELPQLAMVGSRSPTAGGDKTAFEFARYLAAGGFAITSGLALGVDASAHRGALHGGGVTIAVMGTGIDRVYPARNRGLADQILAQGGALVTEFAPGIASDAANFPRRNRVISGLSLGTMVVEAAIKSGSLITAKYALEHQREVFAVPGSIHNPLSRGCHQLIKNGAKLVESAEDIVSELEGGLAFKRGQVQSQQPRQPEHWLLTLMGYDPVSVDQLCDLSGKSASELTATLLDLELEGKIAQRGSYYTRL